MAESSPTDGQKELFSLCFENNDVVAVLVSSRLASMETEPFLFQLNKLIGKN